MEIEFEDKCPYCGEPVIIINPNANALIGDSSYVLVADWVYHTVCWDKQVEESGSPKECPPEDYVP